MTEDPRFRAARLVLALRQSGDGEDRERIRRAMAAAVLRGQKDYPQSVSAFVSAATEEKLDRDLADLEIKPAAIRKPSTKTRRKATGPDLDQ